MGRLDGKAAVITGGVGDIGRAATVRFLEEGARVLIVDKDSDGIDQIMADLDHPALSSITADVTKPECVESYVKEAIERFGRIDVFLNNAGFGGIVQPVSDYPLELFDQIMSVNVRAVWLGLKYVVPRMVAAGSGSIVITSSIMGLKGFPGISPYVASKHAVIGMMKSVAMECASAGVRVNTVHPAPIEGEMMHAFEDGVAEERDVGKDVITSLIPAGRYGQPDEVASILLFLASDDSQFCTGGQYQVDGAMGAG